MQTWAWTILIIGGVFECIWAYTMKLSQGFTHLGYSLITLIAMVVSVYFLAIAMKSLPLGTAYMVWTGIGAVGAFLLGVIILQEPLTFLRTLAALLILSGIALMKVAS